MRTKKNCWLPYGKKPLLCFQKIGSKDILRDLRSPEGLLSVNFPTHKRQVMVCLLNSACDGFVPKEEFVQKAQEALKNPGGPNGRDVSLLSS